MPFEQAPMGTTGLETAFAAVYTANILPLALIVEKLSAGAALMDLPTPEIAVGRAADLVLIDLDAEWEVGAQATRAAVGELLLRRPPPQGQGRHDDRRRRDRLPRAGADRRMSAYVLLEDGTRFDGEAVGAPVSVTGEVVFTTGMSGYQESMTDPSFARQLITFTTAHVGNYGVSEQFMESDRIHAGGAIMRAAVDYDDAPSAEQGWLSWLKANGIPGIAGVDTRALVRHIRTAGSMRGGIFTADVPVSEARERIDAEPSMVGRDLAREVTIAAPRIYEGEGDGPRIVALDTGIKRSIIRNFT